MDEKKKISILEEINRKLDILITLQLVNHSERDEMIKKLVLYGFTNKRISDLTGIPKGTVDMVRANLIK